MPLDPRLLDKRLIPVYVIGVVGFVFLFYNKSKSSSLRYKLNLQRKLENMAVYEKDPIYVQLLLENAHKKAFAKAEDLTGNLMEIGRLAAGLRARKRTMGFDYNKYVKVVWNTMQKQADADGRTEIAKMLELQRKLLGLHE
jgi:hypothetical protein